MPMLSKKKQEKLERSAKNGRARAREERNNARTDRVISVAASAGGYQLARMVNTYIPGPTQAELTDMALKRKSPFTSKRVLIPAGVGFGLALFGGDSMAVRFLTLACGAVAGANATGTAIKLGQIESTELAQATDKK